MREIKFRGKDISSGKWIYGFARNQGKVAEILSFHHGSWWSCEVIPEIVGQFTGLSDQNKKEIYENQQIKAYTEWNLGTAEIIGTIVYNSKDACFSIMGIVQEQERQFPLRECWGLTIIDNPELTEAHNDLS